VKKLNGLSYIGTIGLQYTQVPTHLYNIGNNLKSAYCFRTRKTECRDYGKTKKK